MKPNPIEQDEKRILAVAREIERLHRMILDAPSILLEQPIQRGWMRHYILSKEALARPDRETLSEILLDIGPIRHSRHALFLKKKRRRSRKFVQIDQPLEEILIDRWSTKRNPRREEWKRYFHFEYKPYLGGLQWFYIFTDADLFELKVEPYWLTHVKVIDPLAHERKSELEAWMGRCRRWDKYGRLKGHRNWPANEELRKRLERQAKRYLYRVNLNPEEAETRPRVPWFHSSFFIITAVRNTHVAQQKRRSAQNGKVAGANPAVGTPFPAQHQPQPRKYEMSYPNTQALIESLLNIIKIMTRNSRLRLQPAIRAP